MSSTRSNNPVTEAWEEAKRIWRIPIRPDVFLSLGTGECAKVKQESPKRPSAAASSHPIVWVRSSVESSLSGKNRWREFWDGVPDDLKGSLFRLTVRLKKDSLPEIDDVSQLDELERLAGQGLGRPIKDVATAFLVSSFYFELRSDNALVRGGLPGQHYYKCYGRILCRGNAEEIIKSLYMMHPAQQFELGISSNYTVPFEPKWSICLHCGFFHIGVSFEVRHLSQEKIWIFIKTGDRTQRNISGFPQDMRWFEEAQGKLDPFNDDSRYSAAVHSCPHADDVHLPPPQLRKRKARIDSGTSEGKRSRR